MVKYTWSEKKRRAVRRKHGIDLAEVAQAFDGPYMDDYDVDHSVRDDRWTALALHKGQVVKIVYAFQSATEIGLITAFWADADDTEMFYQYFFGHYR